MRWLWYVGPIIVALVFLWTTLWPTRRERLRAAELRRWVNDLLGPMSDGGEGTQRIVGRLPSAFEAIAQTAGPATAVGNVVLVPKLAFLTVRNANPLAGSHQQSVLFKLAKQAPRISLRPLAIIEGKRQENRGLDLGDAEFGELFEVEGDSAKAVRHWLTPSIRRALCELPAATLRVDGKMAMLTTYGEADADDLDVLVDVADAIFAKRGAGKAPSLFGSEEAPAVERTKKREAKSKAEELAQVSTRVLAWVTDVVLFAAAVGVLMAAISLREEGLEGFPGFPIAEKDAFDGPWQGGWNTKGVGALVAAEAILVGLFVVQTYFAARRGQTLGMRLLGVKAVRTNGSPVEFFRGVLLRGWLVAAIPIAVAAAITRPFHTGAFLGNLFDGKVLLAAAAAIVLDSVVMLVGSQRRALHDVVAGTKVIVTRPDLFDALRRGP